MTDSVLVVEHPAGDRVIGQLTLNVEKTLNSLTREMVEIITERLEDWSDEDRDAAVLIDGAGEQGHPVIATDEEKNTNEFREAHQGS